MPSLNHIHTYVRIKKNYKTLGETRWKCDDPDCTSVVPYELVQGKRSKCSSCGAEIILGKEEVKRARPKCFMCSNTKDAIRKQKAAALMERLTADDSKPEKEGEIEI